MDVIFYRPSDLTIPFRDERNNRFEQVPALLERLRGKGANVQTIDPDTLTAQELYSAYTRATIPAIYWKYEVKRVFGTNRHSACWFGRHVPALTVKRNADDVGDTYPHMKGRTIVTIHEFLTKALGEV